MLAFLGRFVIGIIETSVGFLLVKYANKIYITFGSIKTAEKYLRFFGGTRLVIKLLGILIIFLSFMYIFRIGPFNT